MKYIYLDNTKLLEIDTDLIGIKVRIFEKKGDLHFINLPTGEWIRPSSSNTDNLENNEENELLVIQIRQKLENLKIL